MATLCTCGEVHDPGPTALACLIARHLANAPQKTGNTKLDNAAKYQGARATKEAKK